MTNKRNNFSDLSLHAKIIHEHPELKRSLANPALLKYFRNEIQGRA